MIILKSKIKKFRGFENVELDLGSQLTVIAGQNGTQKTTILGILTQPFTITDPSNPMIKEKPLSGGTFKSAFSEKFKLSDTFDKPKEHEWSLYLNGDKEPFVLESIPRGAGIRFWRKGNRSAGSGYIQLPVIFLSLQRLLPIGEDTKLKESKTSILTPAEVTFFQKWHKNILISMDSIQNSNFLESPNKTTIGINTSHYDWKQNSAGQDNIGKILLAIISFKRLMEKFPNDYEGGILAIDELDATIYPGSQLRLFDALRTFAAKFKIQIIFTTHSLSLLETACNLQVENSKKKETKEQVKVIFLEKKNSKVCVRQDISFDTITHLLNVTVAKKSKNKIITFVEDKETEIFSKALLKGKASNLKFFDGTFSCSLLVNLGTQKIPSFTFPYSFVFLDGDVKSEATLYKKVKQLNNYFVLPSKISPERTIATYLHNLDDNSEVWLKIDKDGTYNKQFCFKEISFEEIIADRNRAKEWFNMNLEYWGHNAYKVIDPWALENQMEVEQFVNSLSESYNKFADLSGLDKI